MPKLLIIEDEVHIQKLIQMVLEKSEFSVLIASNGEEGLRLLMENPDVEVVLLDILMPGIDGLKVLRSIRENSQTKQLPVIMLTALAQENVVLQGIKLGANDYIRKPFHPLELVDRIKKVVENQKRLEKAG